MSYRINLDNDVVCHGLGGERSEFDKYKISMTEIL